MPAAFSFIKTQGGITTKQSYPYNASDGSCQSSKVKVQINYSNIQTLNSTLTFHGFAVQNSPLVTIDEYKMVPENDENALMKAVANQPVSVSIDAADDDFQFY